MPDNSTQVQGTTPVTNNLMDASIAKALVNSSEGTVTSVSVVTANGLAGSVATATTTPAITLSTSITGVLKGNGTAISAAANGTDYSAGTASLITGVLKNTTGTGALSIATAADLPSNGTTSSFIFKTLTAPTPNSSGTVAIVAKDAATLTANAGWLPMNNSAGTLIFVPYWT